MGDSGEVVVTNLSGEPHVLSTGWVSVQGLAWSPKGDEVSFTATRVGANKSLYAVSLSGEERLLLRTPDLLTLQDTTRGGRALLSVEKLRRCRAVLPRRRTFRGQIIPPLATSRPIANRCCSMRPGKRVA